VESKCGAMAEVPRYLNCCRPFRPAVSCTTSADMLSRLNASLADAAGTLATTGLVLNDAEAGNWYYGTNFFTSSLAFGGDTHPARLIRWRKWFDFERGNWEDLSHYLPQSDVPLVPYFLTLHDNKLYTGLFDHDEPAFGPVDPNDACTHDRIFQLDLSLLKAGHENAVDTQSNQAATR
jgi:hypothetical protein